MDGSGEQDRREAVRIDERCLFGWQEISEQEYATIEADYKKGIPLYSQEKLADIQMITGARNALARIRKNDNDLADFLSHLDTKINFILRKVEGRQSILDSLKMQDINISAKGIAFESEASIPQERMVETHILLLPDYVYIYSLARVIASHPVEGKQNCYRNSLEFQLITDEDREIIISYNFSKQSRILRRQRLQR